MWVTVDPGETTGWSIWEGAKLVEASQDPLWDFIDDLDYGAAKGDGRFAGVKAVVCEDWALYPWAATALIWDKQRTVRGIGALTLIARQHNFPFILQPAKIKDGAVAAGAEELFLTPRHENRHANDAIMHGTFYLATNDQQSPVPGERNEA